MDDIDKYLVTLTDRERERLKDAEKVLDLWLELSPELRRKLARALRDVYQLEMLRRLAG